MIRLSVESKLLAMLLFVSIASILAISFITYAGSEEALTNAVYNQLTSLRASRKTQVEDLFKTVRLQASNLADFRTIVDMTNGLRKGVAELQTVPISPEWDTALTNYYRDSFLPALEQVSGRKPILDAYYPRENAARYLQYWYDAHSPYPAKEKYKLNDAGDGSTYSSVHRRYQPIIAKYVLDFGYSNMILADSQTGDVIYGFAKSPILGTNLLSGPYADSNAAQLFKTLAHTKDRDVVDVVDFAPFAPAGGKPVALVGTPVFDGSTEVGVLFIQFPVDATNRIMTGGNNWTRDGLGQTGESYLVGPDMLMRSRSRLLWENPAKFYDALTAADYSTEEIERVRRAGTATLSQRAQTTGVAQALAGHQGTEIDTNYLGRRVLTSFAPLDIPGLHWVIVADMETREAFAPLNTLTHRIMISTVIIILLVSVLAVILGRLFVKPLYRLIDRIRDMNEGEAALVTGQGRHDEFGDLASAFEVMNQRLVKMANQLGQTAREHDALLSRLLPAGIANRMRAGEPPPAERFADASVLFAEISGLGETLGTMPPQSALQLLSDLIASFDDAAERHGVEKLRTLGGSYLAAAGLPVQRLDHAIRMIDFADEMLRIVQRMRTDRSTSLTVRIGVASGSVLTGLVGELRPTFDVWGDVVELARALASGPPVDTILVSSSCHELLHDLYRFDAATQVKLPRGKLATAWPLLHDTNRPIESSQAGSPFAEEPLSP